MSNSGEVVYPTPDSERLPMAEERIAAIARYEGSFSEMEKLALETLARTARDPIFCFELAMSMMRLRARLGKLRTEARKIT